MNKKNLVKWLVFANLFSDYCWKILEDGNYFFFLLKKNLYIAEHDPLSKELLRNLLKITFGDLLVCENTIKSYFHALLIAELYNVTALCFIVYIWLFIE